MCGWMDSLGVIYMQMRNTGIRIRRGDPSERFFRKEFELRNWEVEK